jgi:hypothetical protein
MFKVTGEMAELGNSLSQRFGSRQPRTIQNNRTIALSGLRIGETWPHHKLVAGNEKKEERIDANDAPPILGLFPISIASTCRLRASR